MTGSTIGLKAIIIVIGVILAVVGLFINNLKLATIGNTIAVVGALFT